MKNLKLLAISCVLGAIVLTGCSIDRSRTSLNGIGLAYHSDIKELGNGYYLTEVETSLASGRQSGAEAQVYKNAVDYCRSQNKTMKEAKKEASSHYLVNGVARLTFQCI
ncbi:hypothetical protein [Neisseria iguanae]|uniref:Lipoprotein n=1 Tax=Neisseria iguanae TaxID=90242 RepID=A0A2P7TX08_9NEIS|nr:hypothetical protein [Neisseria iguanae]PSJ79213.1 hypothetical protein C7N83_13590 [Neisseria iguanae]